eukprot:Rmarinus@m.2728
MILKCRTCFLVIIFFLSPFCYSEEEKYITITSKELNARYTKAYDYWRAGEYLAGLDELRQLLMWMPDRTDYLMLKGVLLKSMGNISKSLDVFRQVTELDPTSGLAFYNLGVLYADAGDAYIPLAKDTFLRALELKPDDSAVMSNLASLYMRTDETENAIDMLTRAIEANPANFLPYKNLATTLSDLGRWSDAFIVYNMGVSSHYNIADVPEATAHVLFTSWGNQAYWKDYRHMQYTVELITKKDLASDGQITLHPFAGLTVEIPMSLLQRVARRYNKDHNYPKPREPLYISRFAEPDFLSTDRKLHVAYFSFDFRTHPVCEKVWYLMQQHDRSRFLVSAYSTADEGFSNPCRKLVEESADQFFDVHALSDVDIALHMREQKVDVLIELTGHTKGARIGTLCMQPAPIQAHYFGYAGTIGSECLDYYVADNVVLPKENWDLIDETPAHMPYNLYINSYDEHKLFTEAEELEAQSLDADRFESTYGVPKLQEGAVVFCAFHKAYKITPSIFEVWMNVLKTVPNSVLWIAHPGPPPAVVHLHNEARAVGFPEDRLIIAKRTKEFEAHLRRLRMVTVAMDTPLYNGHITTTDAMFVGTPVVAMALDSISSRIASSMLVASGVAVDTLAGSYKDYEDLVLRLVDQEAGTVRRQLDASRAKQPLFQAKQSIQELENLFESWWHTFSQTQGL